jgi:hypothetical protein
MQKESTSISMICKELNSIPNYVLPPSLSFQWYLPGDEQNWVRIQRIADRYNKD